MIASVNVTDSPAVLLAPPSQGAYQFIALSNAGGETAFLKFTPDDTAVTDTNGIALPAGASILVDQDDSPVLQNGIHAVCAATKSTTIAVQAY